MTEFLRVALPIYIIIYFSIAFIYRSWVVARETGSNPFVLPKDDSAHGLIGRYFKLTILALALYCALFSLFPHWHRYFIWFDKLNFQIVNCAGILLLMSSLIWTIIAQIQMKDSWRIGIDQSTKTDLITDGLFSISRNPIFFGMLLSLVGLFLITPNVLTLIFLILGYVFIQIQIRLEEEYLNSVHRENYRQYKEKTRRFI